MKRRRGPVVKPPVLKPAKLSRTQVMALPYDEQVSIFCARLSLGPKDREMTVRTVNFAHGLNPEQTALEN